MQGKISTYALILFSVALALGAAWMANNWVTNQVGLTKTKEADTVNVVVAALNISYGQTIEAQHIKIVPIPKDRAPEQTLAELELVEGMLAKRDFIKDEMILSNHITDQVQGSILASLLAPKMRAISVRVNDVVGVAGFLLPGNYVDVISARKVKKDRVKAETILQKIKVLAVDQRASKEDNSPMVVKSVTLEISPRQAEILIKAKVEGIIQLTLRNPMEDGVIQKPKKVVAKRKWIAPSRVTLIRGTEAEVKRVTNN